MRRAEEKGQALPLALMALALGALLVSVSLSYVSAGLASSRVFSRSAAAGYAADGGIEDAIWSLRYGDLAGMMAEAGDSAAYSLSEPVNGIVPAVTVTRERVVLAADSFESGGWSGGSGWAGDWQPQEGADVTGIGAPHEGNYHLRLRGASYAGRTIDLAGRVADRLEFWAKAAGFKAADTAELLLSSDGASWNAAWTWVDGDADGYYHPYSIDVSSYSGQLWIAFDGNMSTSGDNLYVDDIALVNVLFAPTGLPQDRFESGYPSGGSGWLGGWATSSNVVQDSGDAPFERYHLKMTRSSSFARRAVDLAGRSGLRLRFQAKVRSFEGGNQAEALVSSDGVEWTVVKTWSSADSDSAYHLVEIDLSPYAMSGEFWVQFSTGATNDAADYFFVDDIEFAGPLAYRIVSTAGDSAVTAVVSLPGGEVDIHSWMNNE